MMGAFPLKRPSKKTKWWTELLEGLACPILLWAARRGRIISGRLPKRLRSRIETSTQNYRGEVIGPKYTPNDCLFMRYLAPARELQKQCPWTVAMGNASTCCNIIYMCVKSSPGGGGEVGYCLIIGMCGAKEYHGFLAVLDWNRVSFLTILVWNRLWFMHSSLELGMFLRGTYFFIIRR